MKMINLILKRFINVVTKNWLFNLLILSYVCFHVFFEHLITNYIVKPFLSTFESNWLTISFFTLGVIISIYDFIATNRNKKFISDGRTYIATIIILFWFYYRLSYQNWLYVNVGNLSFLKYVDIILVGCLSIILSKFCYKKRKFKVDEKLGLLSDNAIVNESQDKLGRKSIAADLATKIINTKAKSGSLAIGIVAPWGYGKTSFLNLLGIQLSNKGGEIIRFNPWVYEKEKSLTMAFFSEISNVLKKYNPELSNFGYYIKLNFFRNLLSRTRTTQIIASEISESIMDPGNPFDRINFSNDLNNALLQIPEKQKLAVTLYYFKEMSQEDCAIFMRITQSAFSKLLERSAKNLKKILSL